MLSLDVINNIALQSYSQRTVFTIGCISVSIPPENPIILFNCPRSFKSLILLRLLYMDNMFVNSLPIDGRFALFTQLAAGFDIGSHTPAAVTVFSRHLSRRLWDPDFLWLSPKVQYIVYQYMFILGAIIRGSGKGRLAGHVM